MEHAQRGRIASAMDSILWSLNPYFNGTCSKRLREKLLRIIRRLVLILILMEHAQREHQKRKLLPSNGWCLNPYFNGTCSKRKGVNVHKITSLPVLILILMEHAQRVS